MDLLGPATASPVSRFRLHNIVSSLASSKFQAAVLHGEHGGSALLGCSCAHAANLWGQVFIQLFPCKKGHEY